MRSARANNLVIALAMLVAAPFMGANEHMNMPCIDEATGWDCWDVVSRHDFFFDQNWPEGPAAGTCFSCLQSIQEAVMGSTFTFFTGAGTTTLTCTVGTVVGTGGSRTCIPGTGPNIIKTYPNVAGTGECNCIAEM